MFRSDEENCPSTADSADSSSKRTRTPSAQWSNRSNVSTAGRSQARSTNRSFGVEETRPTTCHSAYSNSTGEYGPTQSPCRSQSSSSGSKNEATCSRNTDRGTVSPQSSAGSSEQACEETKRAVKGRVPTPGPSKSAFPKGETKRRSGANAFSTSHPLIPQRYVPPWQLDMKNRQLTIEVLTGCFIAVLDNQSVPFEFAFQNCKKGGLDTWEGHISHFWQRRGNCERDL